MNTLSHDPESASLIPVIVCFEYSVMKNSLVFLSFVLSVTITSVQAAAPKISVGALYEYLEPNKSTLLKRVRNSGDATAFVRVSISEVVYGADNKPQEIEVQGARIAQDKNGLIASPARLIVPANGQQATRLLYQGSRDKERYYRVRFVPVVPQQLDEFALSDSERSEYTKELSAGVSVMTGYGVFLIVHPKNVRYTTVLEDEATGYRVVNNGNSTLVLEDFKDCAASNCTAPLTVHLRPQRSHVFKKVAGHTYHFKLIEGSQEQLIRFGS